MNRNGDDEFQEFLDKDNTPIENQLALIIDTIDKKAIVLTELYTKSLESYRLMRDDDPLKKEMQGFVSNLIKESLHTLNQFDYALINDDPREEDDDDDENGDDNAK